MAHWKELARQKRLEQAESIPPAWRLSPIPADFTDSTKVIQSCGILSDEELKLTEITDASVLLGMLARRDLSAVQLTTAFCKRAAVAHQLVNCCTEMFFERALQQARQLDVHLSETGRLIGPLHGLPISIKDGFDIEGVDSTLGWVGLIGKPAKHTGCTAELLYSLGAVLHVKTNIPQSLMMSDSYNHVFGQSVNSLNKNFISGGSSGGEGALVGAKGSVIGIGTDIGGSIRIPAALQGLYGLCPSVGRVPSEKSSLTQAHLVLPVAGPLTTNLNSLELFMESLVGASAWETEPRVLPVPWRKELASIPSRPLKVAFIFDDGVVKPQPPVSRALRETAEKFKAAGHEVVEWDTSTHVEGLNLWLKAVMADGGEGCEKLCQLVDEPLIQGMLVGREKDKLSIPERLEVEKQKMEYRKKYLKHWKESGIDALIMPVVPWVSYKPRTWVQSNQWLGYTALWNLLDFAACSIPATTVDRALDAPGDEWIDHKPRNESDAFNHRQYDVDLVEGMPICLQAVTGRFGEEKAIAIARVMAAL